MGEGPTEPVVDQPTSEPPTTGPSDGHPAWQEVLSLLPSGFHAPVGERLNKIQQGFDSKLQQVHSEYEPFKPFKEAGVTQEQLEGAWQLFALASQDPRALYDQLGQYYGYATNGQGQQGQQQQDETFDLGSANTGSEGEETDNPALAELRQQQQQMQQFMIQQYEQQQAREADAWLESAISGFPEEIRSNQSAMNYILNIANVEGQKTGDFDKGLKAGLAAYDQLVNNVRSAPRATDGAPLVMPSSGGTVATTPSRELNDKDRKAAFVQLLQQAQL
jgi:hypothetical protein